MNRSRSGSGGGPRAGLFGHTGTALGGAQVVDAHLARVLSAEAQVEMLLLSEASSVDRIARMTDCDLGPVTERRPPYRFVPSRISFRNLPPYLVDLLVRHRRMTSGYSLFVCSTHEPPPVSYADRSVLYCHFPYGTHPRVPAKRDGDAGRFEAMKRHLHARLWDLRLDSYRTILANSRFTARWLERRWGRRATVLYPPVTAEPPRLEKSNTVVSVGRFSPDKEQDELIEAFRAFRRRTSDAWRLVLVGTSQASSEHRRYLASLRDRAGGLPVDFAVDVEREEMLQHLARAKLYWHGKGFGGEREPRDLEHFGISTVEAMRARCVPVVPDAGGQREIVCDGAGWRCGSRRELVEASVECVSEDGRRRSLSKAARERSLRFSRRAFDERLRELGVAGAPPSMSTLPRPQRWPSEAVRRGSG